MAVWGGGRARTSLVLQPLCEHGGQAFLRQCTFGCLSPLACSAGLSGLKGFALVSVQALSWPVFSKLQSPGGPGQGGVTHVGFRGGKTWVESWFHYPVVGILCIRVSA